MKIVIESKTKILFSAKTTSLKLAVELGVKEGANLYEADLREANLRGADLCEANLYGANLREAILRGANLYGADLREANLYGANLRGADLYEANLRGADLRGADLREADLRGANLREADLRGADLYEANLHEANLREANLREADLREANLYGAILRGAILREAKGINKYITTPLYLLQDQIGKIRLYKLTKPDGTGPYYSSIHYEIGNTYTEKEANCDEGRQCAWGISLATLDWCIKEWKLGYKIFIAEFTVDDIACIPIGSDGKLRVKKCKIIAEKNLEEIGLVSQWNTPIGATDSG